LFKSHGVTIKKVYVEGSISIPMIDDTMLTKRVARHDDVSDPLKGKKRAARSRVHRLHSPHWLNSRVNAGKGGSG